MPTPSLPLIFLLTPQHTGTHFARMLLETHSLISFGIPESRRIDCDLRPDYLLKGNGIGPDGPENERMLDDFAVEHFHGRMDCEAFLQRIRYGLSLRTQITGNRTAYEELARIAVKDFRILGLELSAKSPSYLLFHGHCGPKYLAASFASAPYKFVVTLRHPLLAVISALRRTNDPEVAHNILCGLDLVLRIPQAHFVCVDLLDRRRDAALDVFPFLGLEPEDVTRRFVELAPPINRTIDAGQRPAAIEETERVGADLGALEQLRTARRMLIEEGRIAPILEPWRRVAFKLQLPARLRRFGYDL
ncbi:MAG: hypothetical protein J0M17_04600 [Planctomycetes bacterium]|nr:hypothetical protein [Planctomycetota bacterium]